MARPGERAPAREGEVGVVVAITPLGELTVRSMDRSFPREGTALTDRSGRLHGRVGRVFGPVARPYFTVRLRRAPRPHDGAALIGSGLVREGI